MNPTRKVKLLIVDDSRMVRKMIATAVQSDPLIEVIGEAGDPYEAREKIIALQPDVLTLDIEMPRMDGLTFLRIIQKHRPTPVIIISSLTQAGSQVALDALEAGAFDILGKPAGSNSLGHLATDLAWRIKGAAAAPRRAFNEAAKTARPAHRPVGTKFHPHQLLLVGSSTGGIEALGEFLSGLPPGLPPICITQHLPAYISKAVAERLAKRCSFEVREAAEGEVLRSSAAYVAPGDFHMALVRAGDQYTVRLNQSPKVNFCRPSVDVMFHSVVNSSASRCVAVLLTGMGSDGASGMKALHTHGTRTFGQDESTCVVFGMPRAAAQIGAVDQLLPLGGLAAAVVPALQALARQPGSPGDGRVKDSSILADTFKAT